MLPKPGSIRALLTGLFAGVTALCLASGIARAQSLTAGSNVNVVGGPVCTSDPSAKNYDANCPYRIFGDVTAQRQNEGSFDCSSKNPLNCVAAGNDYRLVGIAGTAGAITGDAWHGIYWTHDGGANWRSTLLPGWHVGSFVDTSTQGVNSPINAFDATADATVRAGSHGLFYISGVAFNRNTEVTNTSQTGGEGKTGTTFMAVYIDDNKSSKPEDGPRFVRWSVIDTGSSGRVLDKPWIAVDKPRPGALTSTIPAGPGVSAQTIPCGNVYATYTTFLGDGTNNPHSTVWFERSLNCGESFESNATKIAEGTKLAQSASIGIFPNGDIMVVWREFGLGGSADRIMGAKSTNFGKKFTAPFEIANLGVPSTTTFSNAYDAQTYPSTAQPDLRQARSNDYPSLCVDSAGATIAFSKRVAQPAAPNPAQGIVRSDIQFSRIVTMSSANGTAWGTIKEVDNHPYVGHQFQPAVACAGGKRAVLWYDQRNDNAFSLFLDANLQQPTLGLILTPFIVDGRTIPPVHTIDVRARQTTPAGTFVTSEPSIQVSKYPIWVKGSTPADVLQLKYNFMSLPLFGGGILPFLGDYIDFMPRNKYVPPTNATHASYDWNDYSAETPSFQAMWTDNRDVVETVDASLTQDQVGQTSFDTYTAPTLNSCGTATWTRNQNLYTSALSGGFVFRADGNARRTPNLQKRAYALWLYNGIKPASGSVGIPKKYFKLSFDTTRGGPASFSYADIPVSTFTIEVPALSGAARAVFIDKNQTDSVVVLAEESDSTGNVIAGGLKGRVIIAPDPTAPLSDVTLEDHNVQLEPLYFQTQVSCSTNAQCGGGTCEISAGQTTGFCAMPSVTYGVGLGSDPSAVFGDPSLSSTLDPTSLSIGSWGFGSWGFGSWGFGSWGFGSWGFGSWGFGSWGFGSWGFGSWGFGSWGFGSWGFGSTAITSSSFTVTNTGSVESAYDLDTLTQSLPSGSVMQVLVSKIAANPRPTDCNVVVEPTLQAVANASRAGSGALNSSFTLAPNEQAIILVQGSCTPGAQTACFDPQKDLALKVTSQSPDCDFDKCVFSQPPDFDIYDVSPPLLTLPSNISAPATNASGAVVTYTATATDLIDGPVPVSCNPASGSTFPIATTTVTCTASDSRGNIATGSFTVTVTNAAPVASNVPVTTDEDTAVAVTLVASDVENDALTFSIVSGPLHGTLGAVNGSSVTYTPNANYNGTDSFTFKASDYLHDSNVATVNITINPVNDAPVANAVGPITTLEDTPVAVVLSASDVDGDALTYTVTAPAHGTLSGTAPNLTYTPALDYNGPDSFTFKVNDSHVDSNVVTVSINVTAVADAPRPNNDSYTTNEDTQLTVNAASGVLVNDTDPEGGPFTATLVPNNGPSHAASFTLNSDGSFSYMPALNYNGTDTFKYTATDSTGLVSAAATVTITINPVDDSSVLGNDTATVLTGGTVKITVLANDTDPDTTLTITSVSTPQHGTATITDSGTTVTYTSTDLTFSGNDSFTYTVVGGATATVNVLVSYLVNPTTPLAPQLPPKSFNAGSAVPIDWQYKNASGVAVDSFASTLQGQLLTLTFSAITGGNQTNCTGGTIATTPTSVNTDFPGNSFYQYFGASNPHPTFGPYTWQFNWQTGPPIAPGCWFVRIIFDVNQNNPANARWQYDSNDIVIAFPVKLK